MECMLVPEHPTAPLPKVPFVAKVWDGGSWLKYPLRAGKPEMLPDPDDPSHVPWDVHEHIHPTPVEDLEVFFQTWLLFGLLAEALNANDEEDEQLISKSKTSSEYPSEHPDSKTPNGTSAPLGQHGNPKKFDLGHASRAKMALHHRRKSTIIERIYNDFVHEVNGKPVINTQYLIDYLQDSWALTPIEFGESRKALEVRYKRLRPCMMMAFQFYRHLPKTFNPLIKTSIGVVAEILANSMQAIVLLIQTREYCPTEWKFDGFISPEVKNRMLLHGWCPSDITRVMNSYRTLSAIYFISLLDKRKPERSHAGCTDEFCRAYQIDIDTYGLNHAEDGCECKHVSIDNEKVIGALRQRNSLPLLRFVGDKDTLSIEVIPSTPKTPYVALSHVWADGLGNPKGNELHACKLVKLRNLVGGLPQLSPSENEVDKTPLIWLDTLCCPVEPDAAKKLSLTKMCQTYKESTVVLVLDASLQSYSSANMTAVEMLGRIFTSSWLRRLWTLQEGALARQLYFQFADRAISLDALKSHMDGPEIPELRWRIFSGDVARQIDQIQQFFQPRSHSSGGQNLRILDDALKHRGVSVPTDEPLCIGTLMSLPEKPILAVGEQDRMRVVWQLLSKKFNSIPAQIIFFEEPRLSDVGFRWALASFLSTEKTIFAQSARSIRWDDPKPGYPTKKGLKTQYPGFRLSRKEYNDGKPRQPWLGLKRIAESRIIFRNSATGDWHFTATKKSALRSRDMTTEEFNEYGTKELFPLHDMMHKTQDDGSREVFILLPVVQRSTPHYQQDASDALIITGTFEATSIWQSILSWIPFWWRTTTKSQPVEARTEFQAMAGSLNPIEALLYSTVEPLALKLRAAPITDELLAIQDRDSAEYKDALEKLKTQMKQLMAEAFAANEVLAAAVKRLWGDDINDYLWPTIGDWFNHDFWAERLPDEQIWYVD